MLSVERCSHQQPISQSMCALHLDATRWWYSITLRRIWKTSASIFLKGQWQKKVSPLYIYLDKMTLWIIWKNCHFCRKHIIPYKGRNQLINYGEKVEEVISTSEMYHKRCYCFTTTYLWKRWHFWKPNIQTAAMYRSATIMKMWTWIRKFF